MRTTIFETTADDKDITIEIFGEFYPEERGSRDSYGAPIEPDLPAYAEIDNIKIDGKSIEIEELAVLLEYSLEYTKYLVNEAIADAYYDECETYHQNQIDWEIDLIIESKYF